jgi:predicted nucleic acid-binding protein
VVSELERKTKPHGAVIQWFQSVPFDPVAIQAVVIAQLQAGAEKTRLQDSPKCKEIEHWIDEIMRTFAVLPIDGSIFRDWARLMVGKSSDQSEDAMIAATARANGLTVATRNEKDFAQFGIEVFNPFTVAK